MRNAEVSGMGLVHSSLLDDENSNIQFSISLLSPALNAPQFELLHPHHSIATMSTPTRFFRITLLRSAIGLPTRTTGVLKALGLHRRLRTVYHPVTSDVAGQIFAVKELVDVQEVDRALSQGDMRELRRPDSGFYVERRAAQAGGYS